MRTAQALVGVETVVLAILVLLWSLRSDPEPERAPVSGTTLQGAVEPESVAVGEAAVVAASRAANEREVAPVVSAAGSSAVLHGRLLSAMPIASGDVVRLSCRGDSGYFTAQLGDGPTYAFADLSPGTWQVHCEVKGHRLLAFEHELGQAAIQRLDLTLEPTLVLPVFIETSAGKRLHAEMARAEIWHRLAVVATAEPFVGDLAPTGDTTVAPFGVARHRREWDMNQIADSDGDDGTLEIDGGLPVHAVLLLRHMVLARQRIDKGQQEVRFTVDLDAVLERFATVRMRLVGPHGQPISGQRVSVSSASGRPPVSGADGVVVIEKVLPGYNVCEVGLESWQVAVAAGADLDLGDVVVGPAVRLGGQVVGEDGEGVAARMQWTNIDVWRAPMPLMERRTTPVSADGSFALDVAAHRYLVTARTKDGRFGFAVFDGGAAANGEFRITVRPVTDVAIARVGPAHVTYTAIVYHPDGHPVAVQAITPRSRGGKIELPAGTYQLELYADGTMQRREPLVVGDEPMRIEVGR